MYNSFSCKNEIILTTLLATAFFEVIMSIFYDQAGHKHYELLQKAWAYVNILYFINNQHWNDILSYIWDWTS